MPKTLEFVEKEIENIKELFETESFKFDDILCLPTDEVYKFLYDRLQTLEQIKTELEALEVVKTKIKPVLKLDKEDYQPAYYWWIANEIINLDVLDYRKLKKALEVEDE